MSPKAKNKSFPPVKVTEEFLKLTEEYAERIDVYISEFIRMAVKEKIHLMMIEEDCINAKLNSPVDSTHKNNTEEAHKDYIHDKAKQIIEQPKSTMVKPLTKGGK